MSPVKWNQTRRGERTVGRKEEKEGGKGKRKYEEEDKGTGH